MKALSLLSKAVVLMLMVVLMGGYVTEAFARSESIVTHATIVILPSSENKAAIAKEEKVAGSAVEDVNMVTKVNRMTRIDGEQLIYTSVPVL